MVVVVVLAVVVVVAAAAAAAVVLVVVVAAAAVLTITVPNLIILESGFSTLLNLLIFNFFICIFKFCVFVFHRRYTNILCTVAPDVLLGVATHLVTGSGLLQRWRYFVNIAGKES